MEPLSKKMETSSKDGKTSYTIRESYDNEESKTCRIEEVENGFVICIEHNYYEGEGDKKHYKYDEKRYISKTNPLEEMKTKEKKSTIDKTDTKAVAESITKFISGISNNLLV